MSERQRCIRYLGLRERGGAWESGGIEESSLEEENSEVRSRTKDDTRKRW